jgi:hypothetical protein
MRDRAIRVSSACSSALSARTRIVIASLPIEGGHYRTVLAG